MKARKIDMLPCPHCGCKRVYIWRIGRSRHYFAECNACHTKGPIMLFKFRARNAWNDWRTWLLDGDSHLAVW